MEVKSCFFGVMTVRSVEATTEIGYSSQKDFWISSIVPVLPKVSRAVSAEQKKISTYGRMDSMHFLASSPLQRFAR